MKKPLEDSGTVAAPENSVRRNLLRQAAAASLLGIIGDVDAASAKQKAAAEKSLPQSAFLNGFTVQQIQTSDATINTLKAGKGPPLLLLHGAPQTHISWRLVAPELAKEYTVIATDLRGYGDSSKPEDGDNHSNYSKRAMALDQVEVMRHFGFDKFLVVGHDRGGRVAHRMALDHREKVLKLVLVDIVPTYYLYTHVTIEFVQAYFHWFNYLRAAPGPENDLKQQLEAQRARVTTDVQIEYLRTASDPKNIHAMCEDYRAGASIDLQHDAADLDKKIECPLHVLWGQKAPMGRIFDVLKIWSERGAHVTGKSLPGGHTLQEDVPEQFLTEIRGFLKA